MKIRIIFIISILMYSSTLIFCQPDDPVALEAILKAKMTELRKTIEIGQQSLIVDQAIFDSDPRFALGALIDLKTGFVHASFDIKKDTRNDIVINDEKKDTMLSSFFIENNAITEASLFSFLKGVNNTNRRVEISIMKSEVINITENSIDKMKIAEFANDPDFKNFAWISSVTLYTLIASYYQQSEREIDGTAFVKFQNLKFYKIGEYHQTRIATAFWYPLKAHVSKPTGSSISPD